MANFSYPQKALEVSFSLALLIPQVTLSSLVALYAQYGLMKPKF